MSLEERAEPASVPAWTYSHSCVVTGVHDGTAGHYEPVTLTIQVQLAVVWTTSVWDPRLVCAFTDCPDAPVSLIAAVPVGVEPAGTTNT
jgi:hypothetical protein